MKRLSRTSWNVTLHGPSPGSSREMHRRDGDVAIRFSSLFVMRGLDLDLVAQPPRCFARQVFAAALPIRECRGFDEIDELLDKVLLIARSVLSDCVIERTLLFPLVVEMHRERGQEAPRGCEECRVVV